jgi:hypothetical protein
MYELSCVPKEHYIITCFYPPHHITPTLNKCFDIIHYANYHTTYETNVIFWWRHIFQLDTSEFISLYLGGCYEPFQI